MQQPRRLVARVFLPHKGRSALGRGQEIWSDRSSLGALAPARDGFPGTAWSRPHRAAVGHPADGGHCPRRSWSPAPIRRGAGAREGTGRAAEGVPLAVMVAGKGRALASGLSSFSAPAWPCAGRFYRPNLLPSFRSRSLSRCCWRRYSVRRRARSSRATSSGCLASGRGGLCGLTA